MRQEFQLTDDELRELLSISKPVPEIALNCGTPPSAQAMANAFWQRLSKERGFDFITVRPVPGQGPRVFTAEVSL